MAETRPDAHSTSLDAAGDDTPVRYPANSVLGVIDSQEQLEAAITALTGGGFLAEEVRVSTGVARADAVQASTGRSGLAHIAVRIAQRLGIEDNEMEFKSHYEQAMRDGRYVIIIEAATELRRERATEVLRQHGAHTVSFHGRYNIEGIIPPRNP